MVSGFLLQEYPRLGANLATVSNFLLQEYPRPGANSATVSGFLLQEYPRLGANSATVSDFLLQEYLRPGAILAALSCFFHRYAPLWLGAGSAVPYKDVSCTTAMQERGQFLDASQIGFVKIARERPLHSSTDQAAALAFA